MLPRDTKRFTISKLTYQARRVPGSFWAMASQEETVVGILLPTHSNWKLIHMLVKIAHGFYVSATPTVAHTLGLIYRTCSIESIS